MSTAKFGNQETSNNLSDGENGSAGKWERLLPVDALRGLIILVMALDHANLFIAQQHAAGEYWGLPMPIYENGISFLTRFVTHIAAPGFFFLMGVGMFYFARSRGENGWTKWRIIRHFWVRGVILILLQLLIVNRAWELSSDWGISVYFGVLFALGGAMIVGAPFVWLRPHLLLGLIVILFIGSELLHPGPSQWGLLNNNIFSLLVFRPGGDGAFWVNYPILPWLELVLFGLLFGHWLKKDAQGAYRRAVILGVIFLMLFVFLRWVDGFGNIRPREGDGWIDLLNVVKYPPSMVFTLLTMGLNLILLWIFSQFARRPQLLRPLAVFGQAPLFFYIVHLFLYAIMGLLLTPDGSSIQVMVLLWVLGVIVLYPLCLLYGRYMADQPAGSLAKLF